jgi:hypothetical protein
VTSISIAVAVAIPTFGSGLLGLYLQKRLPQTHLSGGSKDMILAVIGLLTLLPALVLGTLVGNSWEPIANALGALDPKTPAQKDALAAAKANLALMEQTRLLMSLQLSSPVAWWLVTSVIFWSMFLFCGFGVLSGTNPTTIAALAFGAISVASAMFLILDLTQPYSGLFRVPPSAIQQTLEAIDK